MAFPIDPLDLRAYLFYLGGWHNITADVFDRGTGVQINWGQADEAPQLEAMTSKAELNNGASNVNPSVSGRYSDNNPRSDLYDLLGQNTPFKIEIGEPHVGAATAELTDTTSHVAPSVDSPTDDAVLLCAWAAPDPAGTYTLPMGMAAAGSTTDARTSMDSAHETIGAAGPTGTRTATFSASEDYCSASVLLHGDSLGIPLTGGFSVTTQSGSVDAGDWWVVISYFGWDLAQLGADTPHFPRDTDGGGWILLADTGTAAPGDAQADRFRMKAWAKRVKTGGDHRIWVDNPGQLQTIQSVFWRVTGAAAWSPQFHGEIAEWPARWDVSGFDRWVPIEAAGRSRRDGRTETPLRDTVHRFVSRNSAGLVGYWALDDPEGSREARSAIVDAGPLRFVANPNTAFTTSPPNFGRGTLHSWLPAGLEVAAGAGGWSGGELRGGTAPSSTPTTYAVDILYRARQGGADDELPVNCGLSVLTGELRWRCVPLDDYTGMQIQVIEDGFSIAFQNISHGGLFNGDIHLWRIAVTEALGNDADWAVYVDESEVGSGTFSIGRASIGSPSAAGIDWFAVPAEGEIVAPHVGQLMIWSGTVPDVADVLRATRGYRAERPPERFSRLCFEEGIQHAIVGDISKEETLMGPQYPAKLLELFREIVTAGQGWLYESRTFRGYEYRTIGSAYNRPAVVALDYSGPGEVAPPLEPTRDDQRPANDITVKNREGASARRVQRSGPKNVNDPADDPDGVGRYESEFTVNVLSGLLGNQAGWRRHLSVLAAVAMTATHEAGHAVVAEALGEPWRCAVLECDSQGRVSGYVDHWVDPTSDPSKVVAVVAAGAVAQTLAYGGEPWTTGYGREDAEKLAHDLGMDLSAAVALLSGQPAEEAQRTLRRDWRRVQILAKELYWHRTATRERALALWEGAAPAIWRPAQQSPPEAA